VGFGDAGTPSRGLNSDDPAAPGRAACVAACQEPLPKVTHSSSPAHASQAQRSAASRMERPTRLLCARGWRPEGWASMRLCLRRTRCVCPPWWGRTNLIPLPRAWAVISSPEPAQPS
jgi:hypothetical protein